MGNIFENRMNRQSIGLGSFYQIQRLKEYLGEYQEVREREKSVRCLKYLLIIKAVMQRADQ